MYRFLIYIAQPYGIPVGLPLQHEIEKRGWEVCWFSELEESKAGLPRTSKILNTVAQVMDFNPHFVLAATDIVADFFPGIKVQLFHGFLANKKPFVKRHFNIRGLFDLYTTQGPSTTWRFKERAKKHQNFEVVETGWSKVDPLFPIETKKKGGKPVIMISSTFTTDASLAKNETCVKEIERLKNTGKYQFICVLHPMLDQATKECFKSMEDKNFSYFDTADIIPLLKQADIMLSDTTSAISEFQLQERPVVTFRNNKPLPHLINVTEVTEIESAIERALTYPEEILQSIRAYNQTLHPYTDGQSSRRMIDACIHFYESGKAKDLKRKPLNLLRRWKIRKKLRYFTLKLNLSPHIVE